MKILVCYFSATGNTAGIADTIAKSLAELGATVEKRDITALKDREAPLDMAEYDAAVFGAPIHSMRAPRVVREWLKWQDGLGKKCAMYLTFGSFQVHPAHYTTWEILSQSNFLVVASAEFLGAHTFNLGGWQAGLNRPDDADHAVAREYAQAIYRRFTGEDTGLVKDLDVGPYTEEQLDQFENFRFKALTKLPTRDGEECQMCMLCEELCPSGAMDAEKGQASQDKCVCCLRCVKICPDEALRINDLSEIFKFKMQHDQETPESLKNKRSRMYL